MKRCSAKNCMNEADEHFDSLLPYDYKRGVDLCIEHRRQINFWGDVNVQRTDEDKH